jgi:4-hydroxy-tetrahydrodipicolinate reductase
MVINVCVAGVSGWTGSAVTRGVMNSADMALTGAIARATAGRDVGEVLKLGHTVGLDVCADIKDAINAETDVFIDYTAVETVKDHVLYAINQGVSVVIGTSGLTTIDYEEIAERALDKRVGVVGGGNFSLTATMMQHLALIAAEHIPQFEVLECAWAEKEDVPSGTARELAEKLGNIQKPIQARPIESLHGPQETRGADINGVQVHCIRTPGFTLRCEAIFGMSGERLVVSHEAGQSAEPYVTGTLLAARKAIEIKGLVRGLDELLFTQV